MAEYPLPPWLAPQAAQGWGELAGQAARARTSATLEQDRMQQQAAQFAIEAQQRSQQAAQANQARQEALNYDHLVEQQKIAIDQQYKQQNLALAQQDEQLAQQQFAQKTSQVAAAHAAEQAFQKAMLPKEQGGEGLDPVRAALKYKSGVMTGTEVGRLATAAGGKDGGYSPGATIIVPGGGTMVNMGQGRWAFPPGSGGPAALPKTLTSTPVTSPDGKVIAQAVLPPGAKTPIVIRPQTTKPSPMDVLRERQGKAAQKYDSKDDVVKAFKDGKLSRDEAAKILNSDFGVPLK